MRALEERGVKVVGIDLLRGVFDTCVQSSTHTGGVRALLVRALRVAVGRGTQEGCSAPATYLTSTPIPPPPHLLLPCRWRGPGSDWPETYFQADLLDAGAVYSCIARTKPDAVIHVAAIPDPTHNPPHTVFTTNIGSTFNVVEACVRLGVPRLVNLSSETVPGFFFPERVHDGVGGVSGLPQYVPVDELHPVLPQDPYALSKSFGEQLCDAAVRRSSLHVISIRPSWCQDAANVERNLGPLVRDAGAEMCGGGASEPLSHGMAFREGASALHRTSSIQ